MKTGDIIHRVTTCGSINFTPLLFATVSSARSATLAADFASEPPFGVPVAANPKNRFPVNQSVRSVLLLLALTGLRLMADQPVNPSASTGGSGASVGTQLRILSADAPLGQSKAIGESAWAVPYGQEFWRRPAAPVAMDPKRSSATNLPATVNVGDVIERVRHALKPDATGANPAMVAATYAASLGGRGLIFSPHTPGEPDAERSANIPSARSDPNAENRLEISAPDPCPTRRRHSDTEADRNVRAPKPDPGTQFTCRTLALRQGPESLYEAGDQSPAWSYEGNTAQVRLNGRLGLLEHYELRSDGVHVSWVLARKPAHTEAAILTLEATGLVYAGETGQGHHFADARGLARVRFGQAKAVDASGRTWPLIVKAGSRGREPVASPPNTQRSNLDIAIPAAILAEAAYPLAIDPVISPEFGMDDPIIGAAYRSQWSPSVAANGTNWLVVWRDCRINTSYSDIIGARVNGSGTVLDTDGIAICTAAYTQWLPSVAANGTDWLVVWTDDRGSSPDIYGARVNGSGTVLDSGGIAICTAANAQRSPSVAANGTDWLVVWEDYRSGSSPDIYGTRVNGSGTVLDSGGIAICTAANAQESPSVAASGTNWLVVWEDRRSGESSIYGTRVTNSGQVLSSIAICTTHSHSPSVASNGIDCLVVWCGSKTLGEAVYGARVDSNGTVLDSGGIAINNGDLNDPYYPSVGANGTNWLVVWQRYSDFLHHWDVCGARVSSSGTVMDSGGLVISTNVTDDLAPSDVATSVIDRRLVFRVGRDRDVIGRFEDRGVRGCAR